MVTVTLNPVSRGSQATSVLENKVSIEDERAVLRGRTEPVPWPRLHGLGRVIASDSLEAARPPQQSIFVSAGISKP